MINIKETLKQYTGLEVAETAFKNPPKLPYIIFTMEENVSGADAVDNISNRDITVELYSDTINRDKEKLIENMLNENSISYSKNRMWLDTEKMFQTAYDFNLYEKMEV